METSIVYQEIELWIKFSVEGAYYPATRESPEEVPEMEIIEVLAGDVDILPLLLESQIEDIYELLFDKL